MSKESEKPITSQIISEAERGLQEIMSSGRELNPAEEIAAYFIQELPQDGRAESEQMVIYDKWDVEKLNSESRFEPVVSGRQGHKADTTCYASSIGFGSSKAIRAKQRNQEGRFTRTESFLKGDLEPHSHLRSVKKGPRSEVLNDGLRKGLV